MDAGPSPTPAGKFRLLAFVAPFAFFMISLQLIQWIRSEGEGLPWWRTHPEHWGYPLQAILCLALVFSFRKFYPRFSFRGFGLGTALGVVGILLWLGPPIVHHFTGLGSEEKLPWLSWLGFQPRTEGFDPWAFGADTSPALLVGILAFRILRLVVAVPLLEEIFWRGFLMRWLIPSKEGWENLPIGTYDKQAFWFTAVAFALAHAGPDFFVALLFGALAGWVTVKTKNLWAVVWMHAVANLLLGLFILGTKWWGLW